MPVHSELLPLCLLNSVSVNMQSQILFGRLYIWKKMFAWRKEERPERNALPAAPDRDGLLLLRRFDRVLGYCRTALGLALCALCSHATLSSHSPARQRKAYILALVLSHVPHVHVTRTRERHRIAKSVLDVALDNCSTDTVRAQRVRAQRVRTQLSTAYCKNVLLRPAGGESRCGHLRAGPHESNKSTLRPHATPTLSPHAKA